jgi:hypothetical protein
MFERIRQLWRRLVVGGVRPPAEKAAALEEDRRVWVRHPSGAETVVQAMGNGVDSRLSARVRNVSRGGINLVVNHRFEPGDVISIELPGGTPQLASTALACVVHVRGEGESVWGLGCTFAEELSEADLVTFGARREKPSAPDDLRTWVRFDCNVRALCQRIGDPENSVWPARVANISASGIGLVVDHAVGPGTLLSLDLESPTSGGRRTILACVVQVTTRSGKEWALGCNFIRELSEADLKALR